MSLQAHNLLFQFSCSETLLQIPDNEDFISEELCQRRASTIVAETSATSIESQLSTTQSLTEIQEGGEDAADSADLPMIAPHIDEELAGLLADQTNDPCPSVQSVLSLGSMPAIDSLDSPSVDQNIGNLVHLESIPIGENPGDQEVETEAGDSVEEEANYIVSLSYANK